MNPAFLPRALTAGPVVLALIGRAGACARADPGQGLVRNQLGRGSRAWRLLPGGRRRHLQEIRPRRHHRAGRSQQQQPHAADRRQARLLHEREHAAILRRGRQQGAGGDGRRHLPEGPAGLPDPPGSQDHQAGRPQAADAVGVQGRRRELFPVAEIRIWLQREQGETLHLQLAALHREQAKRDAGLCHLRTLRGREGRRLQAQRHPAGRLRLQRLFDPDRDPHRNRRQEARPGAALRRCLHDRLVQLSLRRQQAGAMR